MEKLVRYLDLSGGLQKSTSTILQKDNEVSRAINGRFSKIIGGSSRRDGYEQVGNVLDTDRNVNFLDAYFHKSGNMILASSNNSGMTATNLKRLIGGTWTTQSSDFPYNVQLYLKNYLDKAFIVGYSEDSGTFATTMTVNNIGTISDSTDLDSDVFGAPKAKFVAEYKGKIYLANCQVGETKYPNRVYQSSAPTDSVTYVNGDQKTLALQIDVDSARYLKAGMSVDVYGENSNNKKIDGLTIIDVDKANNAITFAQRSIDVKDRDEVYLHGRKNQLSILWNTDYPNEEASDFLEIPTGKNEDPNITGVYVYYNRLWITTNHSIWKWDGANLVCVTKDHGTTSNDSMCEVGGNLVMFEPTGFWAYTDQSRMPQLLSRGIQDIINTINPYYYNKVKSIISGNEYRAYVGELMDGAGRTTSTSTSSTSTSSTTYSTSSTSTSSTSTSSTVTPSTSTSSTSTSTTSISTSSTSLSTSSTSVSTTSTSTSTTTIASTIEATIVVYDFSMNAWSQDTINRHIKSLSTLKMHGYEKVYCGDDTGRVFRMDTGMSDHNKPIPFILETKRFNQNSPENVKTYRRAYVYTKNGMMANISYSVDGKEWVTVGRLNKSLSVVNLGEARGNDIAFRISQNDIGEGVSILGLSLSYVEGELINEST